MRRPGGATLIETIIGISILAIVVTFITATFVLSIQHLAQSKFRVLGTALANEQMEVLRNMPYSQLGTTTGDPSGSILATQTMTRSNISFTVATRIDWVDDPFDGNALGTIAGKPVDTIPTDYKKVQVTITWPSSGSNYVRLTSTVTPKGLEAPTNTGSLLITVFDASGVPVPEADVTVTDTNLTPNVNIVTTTDISGNLQLLGLKPDLNTYHVVVSKSGYTTDSTLPVSGGNPTPVKPDISILANAVTQNSFAIDKLSSLAISTVSSTCTAIPSIGFNLKGQRLIGTPNVLAYDQSFTTDAGGLKAVSNLAWDNYTFTLTGAARNIIGVIPPASLNVLPNTNANLTMVLSDTFSTNSLLASVKDANTGLAVSGASVQLVNGGYDVTNLTGEGSWQQTDWSGGSGQGDLGSMTKYSADDSNVDVTSNPGQVTLKQSSTTENITDSFTATDNRDAAATTAVWDTGAGQVYLAQTNGNYDAADSAQTIKLNAQSGKIVSATLQVTDQANGQTIAYAMAADGATFEAVTPGVLHTFAQTGNDLRLRISLSSNNASVTPTVSDITIQVNELGYATSGRLDSSAFDTGSTSNFIALTWNPQSQPAATGADSVRFQLATNDDDATWDFVGPDGTSATYYTVSGTPVAGASNNHRYIRYRLYLQTNNEQYTPGVADAALTFTTACTPPGQTFFSNLANGTYQATITKTGYATLNVQVNISGNLWNTFQLNPL